jgi:hypothetical protein
MPSRGEEIPCHCVLRNIFHICLRRFRHCVNKEKNFSHVSQEVTARGMRKCTWGRKTEEYCADFLKVSERTLTRSDFQVFKWHFLYGADWRLITRKTGMDKGMFFHAVYRIQRRLGLKFRELKPYPLFPLEDYFFNNVPQDDIDPRMEWLNRRLAA